MITKIKAFLKKNQTFIKAYYKGRFIVEVFSRNLFHFEKCILFMKIFPYTMVDYPALEKVYEIAASLEKNHVKGSFVECGVWKGGAAGIMADVAHKAKSGRSIWIFDSFEGLPEPTKEDGQRAKEYSGQKDSGKLVSVEKCVGPLEDVKKLFFSVLKLNPENIYIGKGWFQDTLPKERQRVGPIALLRLDGDWYESTKCVLENLYDNVVSGGSLLIDDYNHWEGCKKAVDEFFANKNISVKLIPDGYGGVYFQKQ